MFLPNSRVSVPFVRGAVVFATLLIVQRALPSASAQAPAVTSLNQPAGPVAGNATVVITGSGFTGATGVKFGSNNASSYTVNSDTQITAKSPAGASGTIVAVTVTTPGGTSALVNGDLYQYVPIPTITSLSTSTGPVGGGTGVTITGTGFPQNGQNPTTVPYTYLPITVHFYTTNVNNGADVVSSGSPNSNSAGTTFGTNSPASNAAPGNVLQSGVVNVAITTAGGTSNAKPFNYLAPSLSSLTASNSGPFIGGNSISINGTNFAGATTVTWGATTIANFAPPGAPPLSVNPLVPFSATAIGLTAGVPSAQTAGVPNGGPVQVTVTEGGFTTGQLTYTYDSPNNPEVTAVNLPAGKVAGGDSVTITGYNFFQGGVSAVTGVKFGNNSATNVNALNNTTITVTSPAGASGTIVNVTVTTTVGTSAAVTAGLFQYVPVPTITSLSTSTGPVGGGTGVTITGTGFPQNGQNPTTVPYTYLPITVHFYTTNVNNGADVVSSGSPNSNSAGTTFGTNSPASNAAPGNVLQSGVVNVAITTAGGTSNAKPFNYLAPSLSSLTASNSGPFIGGNSISINGTNFAGATTVTWGATTIANFAPPGAPPLSVNPLVPFSATAIGLTAGVPSAQTAGVPNGGPVQVTVTEGGFTTGQLTYTYDPPNNPEVTAVNLPAGKVAGGDTVTITGYNFFQGGVSAVTGVKFGNNSATNVNALNNTTITVTSPAGASGTIVNVTVTTTVGTSAAVTAGLFQYVPVPTITSLSTTQGPIGGFTGITITGTGFPQNGQNPTTVPYTYLPITVHFYTTNVNNGADVVSSGSPNSNSAGTTFGTNSPASNAAPGNVAQTGVVNVSITTAGGTSNSKPFNYLGPTVTSISPGNSGSLAGGNSITIVGTNFAGATTVTWGATTIANFAPPGAPPLSVNPLVPFSATGIGLTAGVPPGTAVGPVSVYVTEGGVKVGPLTYTYVAVTPSLTSLSTSSGLATGGNTVTLTGTQFVPGLTTVLFGSNAGTNVNVTSSTTLTVTVPAWSSGASTVGVTVTTNPGGTATLNGAYTYLGPGVTSISPISGSTAGGTTVTINGTNFASGATVSFGGLPAANVVFVNSGQLTAVSPVSAAAGPVDIIVTLGETSLPTSADQFTFLAPAVTSISPATGPVTGSTSVTINGSNFVPGAAVTFGGLAATNVSFVSSTQLTAAAPAFSTAGSVDIIVTSGAASTASSADKYTYQPVVTSVTPSTGSNLGGTSVVIAGAGFAGTTAVSIGTVALTPVNVPPTAAGTFYVNSNTQITAIAPAYAPGPVNVVVTSGSVASTMSSADEFIYILNFTYNYYTWSSLSWSTPANTTITASVAPNTLTISTVYNETNNFFSWYSPATSYTVSPTTGLPTGISWGSSAAVNIATSAGMTGPFATNDDPSGNGGNVVTGDWKDFRTGQLSYYGTTDPAAPWTNDVFWAYYDAVVGDGVQYSFNANVTVTQHFATPQYLIETPGDPKLGLTSYLASSGMYYFNLDQSNPANAAFSNGAFSKDSLTRLTQISDGTSNTIAFGEALGGPENSPPKFAFTWMGAGVMPSYYDCQTPAQYFMYSSQHPGFVNFAFCDGSVRAVTKVPANSPPDTYYAGPANSNPPTPRWIAFQLLAGINDNLSPDYIQLGLASP